MKEEEPEPKAKKASAKAGKPRRSRKSKGGAGTNPVDEVMKIYNSPMGRLVRKGVSAGIIIFPCLYTMDFYAYCQRLGEAMSNPSIMYQGQLGNGETVMVDDYREAYWWLKNKTPEDSRVMAWWDYGYQIAGIANRTTIADGNTWNHEHIATLGRSAWLPPRKGIAHDGEAPR